MHGDHDEMVVRSNLSISLSFYHMKRRLTMIGTASQIPPSTNLWDVFHSFAIALDDCTPANELLIDFTAQDQSFNYP